MKKVCLKFKSLLELKYFNEAVQLQIHDYDLEQHILLCECSDAEIELAVNGFNAEIIENEVDCIPK